MKYVTPISNVPQAVFSHKNTGDQAVRKQSLYAYCLYSEREILALRNGYQSFEQMREARDIQTDDFFKKLANTSSESVDT